MGEQRPASQHKVLHAAAVHLRRAVEEQHKSRPRERPRRSAPGSAAFWRCSFAARSPCSEMKEGFWPATHLELVVFGTDDAQRNGEGREQRLVLHFLFPFPFCPPSRSLESSPSPANGRGRRATRHEAEVPLPRRTLTSARTTLIFSRALARSFSAVIQSSWGLVRSRTRTREETLTQAFKGLTRCCAL